VEEFVISDRLLKHRFGLVAGEMLQGLDGLMLGEHVALLQKYESINKIDQSINRSSINQSIDHRSMNRSINQLIKQSNDHRLIKRTLINNQSISQSIDQSTDH
jgi:hypothetical protein